MFKERVERSTSRIQFFFLALWIFLQKYSEGEMSENLQTMLCLHESTLVNIYMFFLCLVVKN